MFEKRPCSIGVPLAPLPARVRLEVTYPGVERGVAVLIAKVPVFDWKASVFDEKAPVFIFGTDLNQLGRAPLC